VAILDEVVWNDSGCESNRRAATSQYVGFINECALSLTRCRNRYNLDLVGSPIAAIVSLH